MHADEPGSDLLLPLAASLSRRTFLAWGAAVTLAACADQPVPSPSSVGIRDLGLARLRPPATPSPSAPRPPAAHPPSPSPMPSRAARPGACSTATRALADGRSDALQVGVSILVDGGVDPLDPADRRRGGSGPGRRASSSSTRAARRSSRAWSTATAT